MVMTKRSNRCIVVEGLFLIIVILFGSVTRRRDKIVSFVVFVFELELG